MGGVVLRYLLVGSISAWVANNGTEADGSFSFATLVWCYTAIVFFVVAILFLLKRGESLLGKDKTTGQLPVWSYLVWWPFHGLNLVFIRVVTAVRLRKGIAEAHEIVPGLVLGGLMIDKQCTSKATSKDVGNKTQVAAVIDLTTEFSERLRGVKAYLCLPVWDGNALSSQQLDSAVAFTRKHRKGGVAIHCAFGVGRSTTAVCAVLLSEGKVKTVEEALKLVQKTRPIARLNSAMTRALQTWLDARE